MARPVFDITNVEAQFKSEQLSEEELTGFAQKANHKFRLGDGKIEFISRPNSSYIGDCTGSGNIRLVKEKYTLRTIAHELAHRRHFNHKACHYKITELIFQYLKKLVLSEFES